MHPMDDTRRGWPFGGKLFLTKVGQSLGARKNHTVGLLHTSVMWKDTGESSRSSQMLSYTPLGMPWKKSGMSEFQEDCQVQGASSSECIFKIFTSICHAKADVNKGAQALCHVPRIPFIPHWTILAQQMARCAGLIDRNEAQCPRHRSSTHYHLP